MSMNSYSQTDSTNTLAESDTVQMNKVSDDDFFSMSLEDMMNIPISVTSKTGLTQRESPGIVSVISEEEIMSSGARDLIDILRLVPGISFNSDVAGQVGITMRGNWGLEGKVLFMIDGIELNENLYGSVVYGNHYDPTQIKSIEIIRGPGSSIYGGYAELGVINIITKKGSDYNGGNINYTYGGMKTSTGRQNLSAGFGDKIGDLEFDFKVFSSNGNRSEQKWTDIYGTKGSTKNNFAYGTNQFNLGLKYKGLSGRVFFDDYRTETINLYDEIISDADGNATNQATPSNFRSINAELKYEWELKDNLTITPKINYNKFTPWTVPFDPSGYGYEFEESGTRIAGNLIANWDPTENLNVVIGAEYLTDEGENHLIVEDAPYYYNGKDKISFNQTSAYAQLLWKTKIANVVVGNRFINHSEFGVASAPRIGLTRVVGKFHAKALYSQAFRSPSIENLNASLDSDGNPTIKPEQTQVIETEFGYQLSPKSMIIANVFDIRISDPIVYFYQASSDLEIYQNFNRSGSQGIETEFKYKDSWGFFNLSYSFQTSKGLLDTEFYEIPGNDKTALGVPQHMIKFNTTYNVLGNIFVNTSGNFLSERTVITGYDENDENIFTTSDNVFLWNVFINYKDLWADGLDLGIGVNDILGSNNTFVQPYVNYITPMPDKSTEFTVRASYSFNSKSVKKAPIE